MKKDIIKNALRYVEENMKGDSSHDIEHIKRVWKLSKYIAKQENIENTLIIELGAIFHDIADHKFNKKSTQLAKKLIKEFFSKYKLLKEDIEKILNITKHISFSNKNNKMTHIEGKIVQDADRLDAIGVIGIARAFSYGGYKNRKMYDLHKKSNNTSTIQHFYDKLFLLKDLMNTKTAKKIAIKKHNYMKKFVKLFIEEWTSKYT